MKTYKHGKYVIEPKRDFGNEPYLIDGRWVKAGWVVCFGPTCEYSGCNAMPGATWFETLRDAKKACDILDNSKGHSGKFWKNLYAYYKLV